MTIILRPLGAEDIPRLVEINPTFTAQTRLDIHAVGAGPFAGWRVDETPLERAFDKQDGYEFDAIERENIQNRFAANKNLLEVLEDTQQQKLVGVLDVEWMAWNNTAWIWNLMLDVEVRRKGHGQRLFRRTVEWATAHKLRAILLETQSNNTPACHFYARMGCRLVGVNTLLYSNTDLQKGEVALFWGYTL